LSKKLFDNSKLITIDCLENETTEKSDMVIPAGTFAESDGTFINNEGRAQRYYQVYNSDNKEVMESWRIMARLLSAVSGAAETSDTPSNSGNEQAGAGESESDEKRMQSVSEKSSSIVSEISYEDVLNEIAAAIPILKDINNITPPPGYRIAGQKIPREPHRYSGRTAMTADKNVSEPKPPDDPDSPLTFTMEGYRGEPPSSMIPFFWAPGWNSVQSMNKYQIEVGGPLHGGDPGRRLFEKNVSAKLSYYDIQPKKYERRKGEFLSVPVYHIFGSEELSAEAPAVKELIPDLCLWMNPDDLSDAGVKEDEQVEITAGEKSFKIPVKIKKGIPRGIAGIPVLPGKTVLLSKPVRRRKLIMKYNDWISVKKNDL
jgi:NADH-quinone oxidoreductase subunit G